MPLSTCTAASEPVIDWWRLMRMHKCLPAATKQIQSGLEAVKPHQWQCNHTASPPGHPSWCCPRGQIRLHRCETGRDRTGRYPFPLRTPVSTLNRSHRQQAGDDQIRSRDNRGQCLNSRESRKFTSIVDQNVQGRLALQERLSEGLH